MAAMWGRESQGILLVHNVGTEAAMWTVGVLVLNGLSLRDGWKKLVSPMTIKGPGARLLTISGASAGRIFNVASEGVVISGLTIASKAMRDPGSLSNKEIRSLGASVNTQRPDHKPPSRPSPKPTKR